MPPAELLSYAAFCERVGMSRLLQGCFAADLKMSCGAAAFNLRSLSEWERLRGETVRKRRN
jgi:hypothetical protein